MFGTLDNVSASHGCDAEANCDDSELGPAMLHAKSDDRLPQVLGYHHRSLGRRIRQDCREFLAAVSGRDIAWSSDAHLHQISDCPQAVVAGNVSVRVVVSLEMIDIDKEQAQWQTAQLALSESSLQSDVVGAAVRQSGQSVLTGEA